MTEFAELRVGDHVGFLSGFPFSSAYFNGETGVRLIRIRDLLGDDDNAIYFSGSFDPRWLMKEEDVLIGMDGDFNIVRWKSDPALLNQRILKVEGRSNSEITQDYFYHWCGPRLLEIHSRTAATTVKHLSVRDLERAVGKFPPVQEQRRIATILTILDEVIEATEKLVEKHQQIKAGLMHDLFTRGLWTRPELARGDHKGLPSEATAQEDQLRPTPEEVPGLYQDSPLGLIPKDWKVKSFNEVVTAPICYGIVLEGPYTEGGVLVAAPYNVHGDWNHDLHRCAPDIDQAYARSRVVPGDVLLSVKGTIGRVGVVPPGFVGNISRGLARLRPSSELRSEYLAQLLQSPDYSAYLGLAVVGSTRAELSIGPLRRLKVPIPPIQEQTLMEDALASADSDLANNSTHLAKLRQQKQGLMHDLLTGRVRVDGQ